MDNNGKNLIELDNEKNDLIVAGFKKLDKQLIEQRPPKINWGMIYKGMPNEKKISYLEKLASAMNHAASIVQGERNALNNLCGLKEKQIKQLKVSMDQNNAILQSEITKMNEQRQQFNKFVSKLNKEIKEIKKGQ